MQPWAFLAELNGHKLDAWSSLKGSEKEFFRGRGAVTSDHSLLDKKNL